MKVTIDLDQLTYLEVKAYLEQTTRMIRAILSNCNYEEDLEGSGYKELKKFHKKLLAHYTELYSYEKELQEFKERIKNDIWNL